MLERAMALCGASFAGFFIPEGERLRAAATRGLKSLFKHPGFAQAGETGGFEQRADLRHPKICESP